MAKRGDKTVDLERENAELRRQLAESLAQQQAAAEVLQVINSSSGNLAPVFEAMLERAATLCDADEGVLRTFDGDVFHAVAVHGEHSGGLDSLLRLGPIRNARDNTLFGTLIRGESLVHISDVRETDTYRDKPEARARLDLRGVRTFLGVALRKDDILVGALLMHRRIVRPFSEKQIALLENFAAQAVIAMENARLIAETREALDQQTATAEVLQVINASPGDLAPVFDAMLEKAMRLCEASFGFLMTYDGEYLHPAADRGHPAFAAWVRAQGPIKPELGTSNARLAGGESVIMIPDVTDDPNLPGDSVVRRAVIDIGGFRTLLSIALRKDDALLGIIHIYRQEVRPFTDKQIALLQNFAAQALIAMENARLITETREALEQQTATADVLGVINSSPGNLAPVFDAMLEKAQRLCDATCGVFWTFDGQKIQVAAVHGEPRIAEALRAIGATLPPQESMAQRLLRGEQVIHIPDVSAVQAGASSSPIRRAVVEIGGARTLLAVSLRNDNGTLGFVTLYRQEVRPFTDKQIALLQNFAAQAVIAMQNARLITETREALDQQTATAEILAVISNSLTDTQPVFDAIVQSGLKLFPDAAISVALSVEDQVHAVAVAETDAARAEAWRRRFPFPLTREYMHSAAILDKQVIDIPDVRDAPTEFAVGSRNFLASGYRGITIVPMRRGEAAIGALSVVRRAPGPLSAEQLAVLQTFANQAVIAIENARLLAETREALDQQTATAEVLGVINSSPGDLTPVFDAMVERAAALCEATEAAVRTFDGALLHLAATHGPPGVFEELMRLGPSHPDGLYAGLAAGDEVTHFVDVRETKAFRDNPRVRERLELRDIRSWLAVALRKDGALVGVINVHRREVRPFSDKQIALLRSFAAQAVIAIENARLITETREALEQQTATAEVLSVINSSPGDLAPVFDAMLEKAHSLCEAVYGSLQLYDGERMCAVAVRGLPEALAATLRQGYDAAGHFMAQPLLDGEPFYQNSALDTSGQWVSRGAVHAGIRTLLSVPLRKDGVFLGMIVAARMEPRPFSDKQIALMQNFAAQAVIAMENARLLTETREALDQQTATAEVLGVINSSPGDLAPVFDAMLERAMRLCGAALGFMTTYDGKRFIPAAMRDVPEALAAYFEKGMDQPQPGEAHWRLLQGEDLIHNLDQKDEEAYRSGSPLRRAVVDLGGTRTALVVALRKDRLLLGTLTLYRKEVRPFTNRQISLVQNFAAQAVIAMENARLLTETREALEQQTATAEVLGVINSSPGDLVPVFDAMLDKAMRLCEAAFGMLWTYDGEQYHPAALHGTPPAFTEFLTRGPIIPGPETGLGRLTRDRRVIHIPDIAADKAYEHADPLRVASVELGGGRSFVAVPLLRDEELAGAFVIYRQEVRPFTDKQIALVSNFAAQAVIAIENARLITETREALDQQTATAEILRVVSGSQSDVQPVFEAIVESASKLCEAELSAVARYDGTQLDLVAINNMSPQEAAAFYSLFPRVPLPSFVLGQAVIERRSVNIDDVLSEPGYDARTRETLAGPWRYRSFLGVPILREGEPIGVIGCGRREIKPFTAKQIELVETFAAQAVIAIENARLITETRQARDSAEGSLKELKLAQASLIQAEKMASLGQLTAGIAHEIKNPLNFVNNFASLSNELLGELKDIAAPAIAALDEDKRAELDETMAMLSGNLDKIAEHGRRADGIVKSMLSHSRGGSGERQAVDLNALLDESLNLAYHGARAQDQSFNITLERDFDKTIKPIELVPQDITRVFLNLFGNGFYAANKRAYATNNNGAGAGFRPVLHVATHDLGDAVEIKVRDNGTGIPPAIRDKLFQPFFTTKPTGEGTGLGLSISYDIVTQQHGGTIAVDSEEGQFTEFTIRLPRGTPAASLGAAH